jgi:hypothetical protein
VNGSRFSGISSYDVIACLLVVLVLFMIFLHCDILLFIFPLVIPKTDILRYFLLSVIFKAHDVVSIGKSLSQYAGFNSGYS